MRLPASRKAILTILTAAVAGFAVIHLGASLVEYATGDPDYFQRWHLGEIRRQFNLEEEANLTTWYSSATLLFCAFLLATIARVRRSQRDRFALYWAGLAGIFAYLSLDETAMLHEATMAPLQRFHLTGIAAYEWVAIALPIVGVFLFAYFRFIISLPWRTRLALIVAGIVYLSGGLGFEMVEGVIETRGGEGSLPMLLSRVVEEILEMAGVLLFIRALLDIFESLPAEPTTSA